MDCGCRFFSAPLAMRSEPGSRFSRRAQFFSFFIYIVLCSDAFWITFIGQTIVGASQMFTLGIPPRLAAVWFGPNEVSTACAAGVFGNQLGIAIGFLVPPLLVHNGTTEEVAYDLNKLFLCSAVLNSIILVMILCSICLTSTDCGCRFFLAPLAMRSEPGSRFSRRVRIFAYVTLCSDAFWITFIGQTIVGASQMFTLGIPPRLAAVWFGPNEVSTACAAGVFGNQLGIAIGFLVPPLLVHNGTTEEVAYDLNKLFLCSAVLNSIILVMILCFFAARPPTPPSLAQITAQEEKSIDSNFWRTLGKLLTSKDFVLLFITYGINTGVFYAVSTLLAQMVLPFYPTESEAIGQIGVAIVVAGMLGSVVGGFLLDRFKRFKLTTVLDYLFSFLAMLAFTFTLDLGSIVVVFVNAFVLGFFMTGYLPIGFEFAAEITFPAAEGTTGGLLNASAQIFGMLLTLAMGQVMHGISTFWCNIIMSTALILGTFLTILIKEDQKRQKAHAGRAHLPTSATQLTSCSASD
ncbi:transporter, major facilitator family protein [Ancylostoma duodenale]|uniref:Transporter, major facilitator family protein n=2 Tax=Ancylostoma duodenale TaxID=51022 RepID=A0A0C2GHS8_9BILA|nr:transporter, major facilitator family protein [Ancylostoma duodenale]